MSLGSQVVEDVPGLLTAALNYGTEGVSGQGSMRRCSIATGSRRRRRPSESACLVRGSTGSSGG
jgi:hypothetical protein